MAKVTKSLKRLINCGRILSDGFDGEYTRGMTELIIDFEPLLNQDEHKDIIMDLLTMHWREPVPTTI